MTSTQKKHDLIFEGALRYIRDGITRLEVEDGMTQGQIAKKLGTTQSNVSMLSSGKRGEGIRLSTAIRAFRELGGSMAELLNEVLNQRQASVLIAVADEDEELFDSLIDVLESGGEEREQLKNQAMYLQRKLGN